MAREGLMDDTGYFGFEEPEYPCDKCAHKDDCDNNRRMFCCDLCRHTGEGDCDEC